MWGKKDEIFTVMYQYSCADGKYIKSPVLPYHNRCRLRKSADVMEPRVIKLRLSLWVQEVLGIANQLELA
jgi:hypothetical protein